MMYATRLKMQQGCKASTTLLEIDEVFIKGCKNPRFFPKEELHDYLKENPGTICVNISPYPKVTPATSPRGEKYVKSTPNQFKKDNLLSLPRI